MILNCVLAFAALVSVWASLKVARSAESQAKSTNDTVDTANEQLKLGRESLAQERAALQASVRPLLADVPLGVYVPEGNEGFRPIGIRMLNPDKGRILWTRMDDNTIEVRVPVRNIGSGPAFIHDAFFTSGPGVVVEATLDHQVIPVGELARVSVTILATEVLHGPVLSAFMQGLELAVGVRYSDSGGSQRTQSVVVFTCDDTVENPQRRDGDIARVEFYTCDEQWMRATEPYLSTGAS